MAINIPQTVALAQQSIQAFLPKILPLAAFSTNFANDAQNTNMTVRVPIIGKPTPAAEFSHATGYGTTSGSTLTCKDVALTHRLRAEDPFNDTDFESLTPELLAKIMKAQLANVLDTAGKTVLTALLAKATLSHTLTTDSFTFNSALAVKTAASKASLPNEGRVLILDSASNDTLVADPLIASAMVQSIASNALQEGETRRIAGMNVFEQPNFGDGSAVGALALPYSLAIASRPTPPSGREILHTTISDEKTGFSVTQKIIAEDTKARVIVITEVLFGAEVIVPEAVMKILPKA